MSADVAPIVNWYCCGDDISSCEKTASTPGTAVSMLVSSGVRWRT